jgi:hypothetical protein
MRMNLQPPFSQKVIQLPRGRIWLLTLCSAVSLNLSLPSARADILTVAFPTAITVPENNLVHFVTYAITNVSGANITINSLVTIPSNSIAGDPSDIWIDPVSVDSGNCGPTLANGARCLANMSFMVPDGTGETDANFGQFTVTTTLSISLRGAPMSTDFVTTVTVTDPPVPGPVAGAGLPGLVLAGGGLLGWWRRRKKNRLSFLSGAIRNTSFAALAIARAAE